MTLGFAPRVLSLPDRIDRGAVAIDAAGIGYAIDGKRILDSVSLDVRAGELLALVGPNGAGKSSLLAALSGDIRVDGEIRIADRELSQWRIPELARHRAVLPQSNALSFPFTVVEVVAMGRAPWHRTAEEDHDEQAIADSMGATEVQHLADRQYPSLSGGERARASLARVLAQGTGILMLDEPTAALDIKHQETVLQIARQRVDAGDAVVVVLHDLNLAAAYADRVALLHRGALRRVGPPAEVLTAESISEVYQHPVKVIRDDASGGLLVMPIRHRRV